MWFCDCRPDRVADSIRPTLHTLRATTGLDVPVLLHRTGRPSRSFADGSRDTRLVAVADGMSAYEAALFEESPWCPDCGGFCTWTDAPTDEIVRI